MRCIIGLGAVWCVKMVLPRALRVNSIYFYAIDSAMRFNFRLLAVIAISAVSGITYAQSSGTAFVVAPGLLVTNQHVVDGCGSIEVIAADGRRPATVVDSVEQIDLALHGALSYVAKS